MKDNKRVSQIVRGVFSAALMLGCVAVTGPMPARAAMELVTKLNLTFRPRSCRRRC